MTGTGSSEPALLQLKISRNFDSFGPSEERILLEAIGNLLKIDGCINIRDKRRGCVQLTVELTREQAKRLISLVEQGLLESYGVTEAKIISYADLQVDLPFIRKALKPPLWATALTLEKVLSNPQMLLKRLQEVRPEHWRTQHAATLEKVAHLLAEPTTRSQAVSLLHSLLSPLKCADAIDNAIAEGWAGSLIDRMKKASNTPLLEVLADFALNDSEAKPLWKTAERILDHYESPDIAVVNGIIKFVKFVELGYAVPSFWGLLHKQVQEAAIDHLRIIREKRPRSYHQRLDERLIEVSDPTLEIVERDWIDAIQSSIKNHLGSEASETFCLVYLKGYSYDEAARQLGIKLETLKTRLHRIRAEVRRLMEKWDEA